MQTSSPGQAATPPHLESFVSFEWAAWRWFVLRGAGFPARLIEDLAQPACAEAADALLAGEKQLDERFVSSINAVDLALDQFRGEGREARDEVFRRMVKARRKLAERKVPDNSHFPFEVSQRIEEIKLTTLRAQQYQAEFASVFSEGIRRQSEALRTMAGGPQFQEAVVWQNRRAFETAVQPLSVDANGATRNQHQRNREQLVAKYAQRYCVKNDTIGFFGPAVWGQIESDQQRFRAMPGTALFGNRRTYFETWVIDRLALTLSRIEGMEWWIPPRLAPDVRIENKKLYRPGSISHLTELEEAALHLCDGTRLPGEILARLKQDHRFQFTGTDDVRTLLAGKATEGIIVWRFLVPVEVNSELALRQQLQSVGDVKLRQAAMERLDIMEAARGEVIDAAGDASKLNRALFRAEQRFEEITQSPGSRNPGATYGARTLFYEDCRRDFSLRITPDVIRPIVPALALLLHSLRWLVQSIAIELNDFFGKTYRELLKQKTANELPLLEWWLYTEPELLKASPVSELEKRFSQKWADILNIGSAKTDIVIFKSEELKSAVQQIFPEVNSRYCPVRYFCPDLMLAAESVEAITRGELLYVLGEVHSGKNTLAHAVLTERHPNTQQLLEATEWDWGTGRFKILEAQQSATATARTSDALFSRSDCLVATTSDSVAPKGHLSHPISEFAICEQDRELHVVNRRSGKRFHVLEAFSDLFSAFIMNKGSWIPPLRYTPRILIDNLVVRRATWRFQASELAFAREKDEGRRFLEARRWMKAAGLPRRTFVRSALEVKPFYVDLDSPILIDVLSRAVRVANSSTAISEFSFSEMLPDHNQLWLQDANGMRYTSELRFAVVDLKLRAEGVASHAAMS